VEKKKGRAKVKGGISGGLPMSYESGGWTLAGKVVMESKRGVGRAL